MPSEVSRTSRNAVGPAVNSARPPVRRRAIAPAAVVEAAGAAGLVAASAAVGAEAADIAVAVVVSVVEVEAAVDDRRASASRPPAPNAANKRKCLSSRRKVGRFIAVRATCRARIREWVEVAAVTDKATAVAEADATTRATISPHGSPTLIDRVRSQPRGDDEESMHTLSTSNQSGRSIPPAAFFLRLRRPI